MITDVVTKNQEIIDGLNIDKKFNLKRLDSIPPLVEWAINQIRHAYNPERD